MSTEAEVIAQLAQVPTVVELEDQRKAITTPPGWDTRIQDDEAYRAHPRRAMGHRNTTNIHGWIDYIGVHAEHEHPVIEIQKRYRLLDALLNSHGPELAGWEDHRIGLNAELSRTMARIIDAESQWMNQEGFAEFLYTNGSVITSPQAADVMSLVENLEATVEAVVANTQRLDNGARNITFTEAVSMNLTVPTSILVELPVFTASDSETSIMFDIHTRVTEGSIMFKIRNPNLADLLDDAFEADISEPALELLGGTPILLGN